MPPVQVQLLVAASGMLACCTAAGRHQSAGTCCSTSRLSQPSIFAQASQLPQILVAEGLHPFHDERVRKLMDFHVYLDISDEVKEAWKIQRDMKERGHSEESIRASIAARQARL